MNDLRRRFEETKNVLDLNSGWPKNLAADPNCKTCSGHGVVDSGCDFFCEISRCPDCWNEKIK